MPNEIARNAETSIFFYVIVAYRMAVASVVILPGGLQGLGVLVNNPYMGYSIHRLRRCVMT